MQRNKAIRNDENRKQRRLFSNWNIDITIKQVSVTMYTQKVSINTLSHSKAPKTQLIAISDMRKKLAEFLYGTECAPNLALAIILLTWVP